MRNELEPAKPGARGFATTHWSAVAQAAQPDSRQALQALDALCRSYWAPLHQYIRQRGYSAEDTEDFTQGFFCELLEKRYFRAATRERGRFRTFLLTALRHFLSHQWEKQQARKRGGHLRFVPYEEESAGAGGGAPGKEPSAERSYDRNWALAVFAQGLARLRRESAEAGQLELFEQLKIFLSSQPTEGDYARAAMRLGSTRGNVTVAVHRLRQRYGECVRGVVRETVTDEEEVQEELRYLISLMHP